MATHDVNVTIPEKAVGNVGVEFKVKLNDSALGTLQILKGSVFWVPAGKPRRRMSWTKFDDLMQKHGEAKS